MNKALDAAKIAEMSLNEAHEAKNSELTKQLTKIRRDLKRMAEKYDSITPSACVRDFCKIFAPGGFLWMGHRMLPIAFFPTEPVAMATKFETKLAITWLA